MVLHQPFSTTVPTSSDPVDIDYDVAIVGGGIVGLTLACALKETGLRIALIEASPKADGLKRRRAYHITLMSGRIFAGLGVWEQIHPRITTFNQIYLADEQNPAIVHLKPSDLNTSMLGYVAEHEVLAQALQQQLEGVTHVEWLCPAEVIAVDYQAKQAVLTIALNGTQIQHRTRLVIAADGVRSPLRQQAGIQTQGWKYWQSCITAVIRSEKSHQNIAREHFWSSGPFATLPLTGNRAQIVMTAPHAEAAEWMAVDESVFLAELDRRYDGKLGQLSLESDRLLFPVQLMHSNRYVSSRLALVGDAAHCCHPVGGQGMNLGIRDAVALAEVLETAYQQGKDIGSLGVLRRYERWRQVENLTILGFTDFLNRCFSTHWLPMVFARRGGLVLMGWLPFIRSLALRLMTGLSGRIPKVAQVNRK